MNTRPARTRTRPRPRNARTTHHKGVLQVVVRRPQRGHVLRRDTGTQLRHNARVVAVQTRQVAAHTTHARPHTHTHTYTRTQATLTAMKTGGNRSSQTNKHAVAVAIVVVVVVVVVVRL